MLSPFGAKWVEHEYVSVVALARQQGRNFWAVKKESSEAASIKRSREGRRDVLPEE